MLTFCVAHDVVIVHLYRPNFQSRHKCIEVTMMGKLLHVVTSHSFKWCLSI